jgi:hypothetical protein
MISWILAKFGEVPARLLSNFLLIGCPPAYLRNRFPPSALARN